MRICKFPDSVFTQLVESPTTPQGTLIDHVYYKGYQQSSSPLIVALQPDSDSDCEVTLQNVVFCI